MAAVSLSASAAMAADTQGRYSVEGPGSLGCQAYLDQDTSSQQYSVIAGFVSGYLSAYNRLLDDTYDLTPWQTLELSLQQLRRFCTANPNAVLIQALEQYTTYLAPNRLIEEDDRVSLNVGEQVVVLYQSTIDRIRTALSEQGFGIGDEPLSGLKDFQAANDIDPSGLPNQRTLAALFGSGR